MVVTRREWLGGDELSLARDKVISVKKYTSLLVLLPGFLRCNDSYIVAMRAVCKSHLAPLNIVKNSLKMLIYFHGNSAFSLPNFMTYRASLWD
ncbi:MAG: hypothetical protein BECKG1743E_GA0114224_105981, partial [Candidatus Kentron sp. G]